MNPPNCFKVLDGKREIISSGFMPWGVNQWPRRYFSCTHQWHFWGLTVNTLAFKYPIALSSNCLWWIHVSSIYRGVKHPMLSMKKLNDYLSKLSIIFLREPWSQSIIWGLSMGKCKWKTLQRELLWHTTNYFPILSCRYNSIG